MVTKTKEVGIRLSVKEKDIAERALKEFGAEGAAVFKRIDAASKPVSGSLLAIDRSMKVARSGMAGFMTGAAAALLPTLSVAAAINGAKAALDEFGQIADDAKSAGLGTDLFQGLMHQARLAGIEFDELSGALDTFHKNAGLAAVGKGRMVGQLRELNPELLRNIQLARSQEERIRLVAEAIDKEGDASRKAAIAAAAFGEAGLRMVDMFKGGAAAIDGTMASARELGIIVDREVIARAEELGDKFDTASKIVDLQLKQALIDLAPFMVDAVGWAAELAKLLGIAYEQVKDINQRVHINPLQNQLIGVINARVAMKEEIAKLETQNWGFADFHRQNTLAAARAELEKLMQDALVLQERIAQLQGKPAPGATPAVTPPADLTPPVLPVDDDAKRVLREAEQLITRVRDASAAYAAEVAKINELRPHLTQEEYNAALGDAALNFAKAADGSAAYAAAEERLRAAIAAGQITQEEYTKSIEDLTRRRLEAANTWEAGVQLGLMRIAEAERNVGKDIGDALVNGVQKFEDAWISALETGEFKWQDLVKGMLLDIARMSTKQLITGPISGLLGGMVGGGMGGGGTWGQFGGFAGRSGMFGLPSMDGGGFTGSGPRSGGVDGKGGFPAILHPNETVFDHTKGGAGGTIVFQQTNYIDGASGSPEQLRAIMDAHGRQLLAAVPAVVKKAQSDGVFG